MTANFYFCSLLNFNEKLMATYFSQSQISLDEKINALTMSGNPREKTITVILDRSVLIYLAFPIPCHIYLPTYIKSPSPPRCYQWYQRKKSHHHFLFISINAEKEWWEMLSMKGPSFSLGRLLMRFVGMGRGWGRQEFLGTILYHNTTSLSWFQM